MAADERDGGTGEKMPPAAAARKAPVAEDAPRSFTMRPIGGLIARVTRAGFRRRAPAGAQIMMDWVEIMGPVLGNRTQPQKISAGTLTIAAEGPVAMELQHLAPQLIARLNSHVGSYGEKALIKRLRFVQQAPTLSTRTTQARPAASRRAEPPPTIAGIESDALREALERLGQAVLSRRGETK